MAVKKDTISTVQLIFSLLFPVFFPTVIIALSGDLFWAEGWIWGIWFIALCVITTLYLYMHDPALLKERFQNQGINNQKPEQAYLIYLTFLIFLAWIVIMPIDAKKCSWTEFPVWLKALGGLGLIPSFYFIFRAFYDNTFLSPLIRIQKERKQKVVSTGVYGFVRHPMYLGAVFLFVATPLLLGSLYGLLLGVLLIAMIMLRTIGEEQMLINELDGYKAYKKKVKYRLIPFIW
jgi:protein-S-isoprenylcysteine O-methyltransferase Ste14